MKTGRKQFEIEETETCGKCGTKIHTYRRWFHAEMYRFLVRLVEADGEVLRSDEILPGQSKASSDGVYLIHWGLVAKEGKGKYRATYRGTNFVKADPPPKEYDYIRMRQGSVIGFGEPTLTREAFA
jgi:hypothetical protein